MQGKRKFSVFTQFGVGPGLGAPRRHAFAPSDLTRLLPHPSGGARRTPTEVRVVRTALTAETALSRGSRRTASRRPASPTSPVWRLAHRRGAWVRWPASALD